MQAVIAPAFQCLGMNVQPVRDYRLTWVCVVAIRISIN